MDGESFDRLSVVVHRLRDKATRRGALGLLIGGSLAAASTLLGEDADAKKNKNKNKNNKNCRGYGARCSRNSDCCYSKCRNGFCWYGGNGGGGGGGGNNNCGGRKCPAGWRCCKSGGVSVCVPNSNPVCCGNNGYVNGYRCCGGYAGACPSNWKCCGGFNQCCQPGYKCCGNGRCCPDGWNCGDFVCEYWQSAEVGSESAQSMPFVAAEVVDDADWISLGE